MIDPEEGRTLIDNADKNRRLRIAVVHKYARRMKEGLWKLNGQPIILSDEGKLLDGQHRLEAVALVGKPQVFLVVQGKFDFKTMDENKPRDGADVLGIETDFKHLLVLQSATRHILRHEYGIANEVSYFTTAKGSTTLDVENSEILAFVKKNPMLLEIATKTVSLRSSYGGLVPVSPTVAAWFLVATKHGHEDGDTFFECLLSGAGLPPGDPRLALRRRLANETREGHRTLPVMSFALICKAWNIRGQTIKVLVIKDGEAFPFIR
jgi:hypothetical protein